MTRCGVILLISLVAVAAAPDVKDPDVVAGKALGLASAPVTIELFSDYQCPSCRELYIQTIKPLIADYVNKGKVFLIHRDFPLQIHPFSVKAADYANAAARISRFEPVAGALFEKQAEWSTAGSIDKTLSAVLTPAELRRVQELSKKPEIEAAVRHDTDLGKQAGVNQTPTMVIWHGGAKYPVSGFVTYAVFRRFIDGFLSR